MDRQFPVMSDFIDLLNALVSTYQAWVQPQATDRFFECTRVAGCTKIIAFAYNLLEHLNTLFRVFPLLVDKLIGFTQTIQLVDEGTEIRVSGQRSSRGLSKFLVQWFWLCSAPVPWSNPLPGLESTMKTFLTQSHDVLKNFLGARLGKHL